MMLKGEHTRMRYRKALVRISVGVIIFVVGLILCLKLAPLPVAVSDAPFPFEKQIVKIPLRARISRQMEKPPFGGTEEVYQSGAQIYKNHCSVCHGMPGHDSVFAQHMYPPPPQLWK
jgi:thiosulfate dehydrogenase